MNGRFLLVIALLACASSASAQVYRWVDEKGRVHYSNAAPDTQDCYTLRCQGERMERRMAVREELEMRQMAVRVAAAPPRPRGLDFRDYISLRRGMTEGELVTIAGSPDMLSSDVFADSATRTCRR